MPTIMLRDICHARSGDKGDTVNLGLLCYNPADYEWLKRHVTTEAVLKHFAPVAKGPAKRFELPILAALNFLIDNALDGGVTKALAMDGHGKGYSSIFLEMKIETNDVPLGRTGMQKEAAQ
jgi:hypothetical protein